MSKRRRRCCSFPLPPQTYEPRVECALEALRHGLTGCQMLVQFLLAEEGVDAPQLNALDAAASDFEKTQEWLAKVRH